MKPLVERIRKEQPREIGPETQKEKDTRAASLELYKSTVLKRDKW